MGRTQTRFALDLTVTILQTEDVSQETGSDDDDNDDDDDGGGGDEEEEEEEESHVSQPTPARHQSSSFPNVDNDGVHPTPQLRPISPRRTSFFRVLKQQLSFQIRAFAFTPQCPS